MKAIKIILPNSRTTFITFLVSISLCAIAAAPYADAARARSKYEDAKLFLAKMDGDLDGFIASEIIKEKLPVHVVTEEANADYILVGTSVKADDHWYNTVFNGKDKNEGNVRLLGVKDHEMVWAGEAGDRSLWFGSLKRGGERKVAERIVKQMRKDLF